MPGFNKRTRLVSFVTPTPLNLPFSARVWAYDFRLVVGMKERGSPFSSLVSSTLRRPLPQMLARFFICCKSTRSTIQFPANDITGYRFPFQPCGHFSQSTMLQIKRWPTPLLRITILLILMKSSFRESTQSHPVPLISCTKTSELFTICNFSHPLPTYSFRDQFSYYKFDTNSL